MLKIYLFSAFFLTGLIIPQLSFSQLHQSVFSNLSGQELLDQLKETYKPASVLPHGMARDTMIKNIDTHNDTLTCVYTGYQLYINPNLDPSQAAYMDGNEDGMNTEHTWPQSLGASGVARGDIHNLFPTRIDVNADRASLPFGDIPDNETDNWYFQEQVLHSPPSENRDLYSEWNNQFFEPREDHKGNVARTMFYFYTMYKNLADAEDPNFFENQRATFCQWHYEDPVDEQEWERNFKIAPYQHDKLNPFVLDCTLPERSYCSEFDVNCGISNIEELETDGFVLEQNVPNPFSDRTLIKYQLERRFEVRLSVLDVLGKEVAVLVNGHQTPGNYEVEFEGIKHLSSGLYFYQLWLKGDYRSFIKNKKIIFVNQD